MAPHFVENAIRIFLTEMEHFNAKNDFRRNPANDKRRDTTEKCSVRSSDPNGRKNGRVTRIMNDFPQKQIGGILYNFEHLVPIQIKVPLNASGTNFVDMLVTFGCHCFTEEFNPLRHKPHIRYTYKGEVRAFDVLRHECSLQLPQILQSLLKGTVYFAGESYTYAAHITLASLQGSQTYSVFFSLEKNRYLREPALRMFVKSAYLKPLVARTNAQSWRFASLAGQIAGVFPPKEKKTRPFRTKEKEKAP